MSRTFRIVWLPVLLLSIACSAVFSVPSSPTQPPVEPSSPDPEPGPTEIPLPTLEGMIAYSSGRNGLWQIVAMNADGSDETSLTAGFGAYSRPAWSPNGQQIAMRMEIEMGSGIAVMDVHRDNGKLRGAPPVAVVNAFADAPQWSPDGTRLVYVATDASGGWITYNADLSTASTLTVPGIPVNATNPDWSPNGNRIVFSHYTDPSEQVHDLYTINTDGSGMVQLTNTPAINEDEAIWSPDGQRIVFTKFEQHENGSFNKDIFIMNQDGTNIFRLTTDPGGDFDPSWSPDGRQIVFVSDRHENNDGNYEVYVINADGTGELRLTNNHFTDRWPTWRAKQADDVSSIDCQPQVTLAADVTIPGGTRFATPQPFTKVWRLHNSGTCTWTPTNYTLRFVDGEKLGDTTHILIPGAIQPGATVDLAIPQAAPAAPGRHVAHWQLFQRGGQAVPGADGNPVTLAVDIEVLPAGQAALPQPLYFISEQSGSAQIWRMETDAHTLTQVTKESQPVNSFAISPAGKVAFVSQNQVLLSDSNGGNRQVIAELDSNTQIFALAWSSAGDRLAYASKGIHLYDPSTGQDRLLIADKDTQAPDLVHYAPLEWSPDGSKLTANAYLWESGDVHIISTLDGTVLAKLPWETSTWNRDSQSIYLASPDYPGLGGMEPGLWRGLPNGSAPQPLIGQASVWLPHQRLDGSLLYFMHQPVTPETIEYAASLYVASENGSNPIAANSWQLHLSANDGFNGAWTEDGRSILIQLVRPALDVNEVLLLSADTNPPLFLMPEIKEFHWGN